MREFQRIEDQLVTDLEEVEVALLTSLVSQVDELLGGAGERAAAPGASDPFAAWESEFAAGVALDRTDPVIGRLFPDASADDAIYSCVPGIIINDPDGVRIQFLELYSRPGSESRPVVGGDLIVKMDAGPINAFK